MNVQKRPCKDWFYDEVLEGCFFEKFLPSCDVCITFAGVWACFNDSTIVSQTLRERIGQLWSLTYYLFGGHVLFNVVIGSLSSVPLVAVLIDLRLCAKAELTEFLIPIMALASFFSRALKIFLSPLSKASPIRCESTWKSSSIWSGAVKVIELALVVFAQFLAPVTPDCCPLQILEGTFYLFLFGKLLDFRLSGLFCSF